jgi:hypothetical protein
MAKRDRRESGSRTRPSAAARGSSRPRQAPRPVRSLQAGASFVTVSAPSFVDLSADEERRAVEALAELLVPLLLRTGQPESDLEVPAVTGSGDA